jgi:hypothetical protein
MKEIGALKRLAYALGKADLCLEPFFAESLAVGKGSLPRG